MRRFPIPLKAVYVEVAAAGNVLNFDRKILVGRREKENVAREEEHVLYKNDFSNALFLQEAKMKDFDWHF